MSAAAVSAGYTLPTVRPQIEPFIGQIVDGIHQAFSISIANTMIVAVIAAAAAAAVIAAVIPELTLRHSVGTGAEPKPTIIPAME